MSVLFYVETDADAERCLEAAREQEPITIDGYVTDNSFRTYAGVVEYVQDCGEAKARWRWLVSMNETIKQAC